MQIVKVLFMRITLLASILRFQLILSILISIFSVTATSAAPMNLEKVKQLYNEFGQQSFARYEKAYTPVTKLFSIGSEETQIKIWWGTEFSAILELWNALYVPEDHHVSYGNALFVSVEQDFSKYGTLAILAHEWAHHFMNVLNIPQVEETADCIAGTFLNNSNYTSQLITERLELIEIKHLVGQMFCKFGSPDSNQSHPPCEVRRAAFLRGIENTDPFVCFKNQWPTVAHTVPLTAYIEADRLSPLYLRIERPILPYIWSPPRKLPWKSAPEMDWLLLDSFRPIPFMNTVFFRSPRF